jgi:hypothetical protein
VGQHSSASVSALLDLDGFQLVSAELVGGEWQLAVQATATVIGCAGCGCGPRPMAGARSGSATCPVAAGGAGLAQAPLALS